MTSPAVPVFQWSELARRSADVGEALDEFGEINVIRGTQTLRLAPPPTQPITDVLRDMCRVLSVVISVDNSTHVSMILNTAWPWTRALPADDQLLLAKEVGPVAEMCESLGTWRPLLDVLADWRGTARAHAEHSGAAVVIEAPTGTVASRPA
jgi:hypothetical protein